MGRARIAFLSLLTICASAQAETLRYDAGDNRLTLRRSGAELIVLDDATGAIVARSNLARLDGVVINGASGPIDDTLTVDFSGGKFAFRDGIRYDGGTGGYDTLVVKGGSFERGEHDVRSRDSGVLKYDGLVISYSNLEPLSDSTAIAFFTINGTDNAETIGLDNGTANGDGILRVTFSDAESLEFSNKQFVTINGGMTAADLSDAFTIANTESATGLNSITINTGPAGGGSVAGDIVNVVSTGGVPITINGDAGNDAFVFGPGATLNGGTIDGKGGTDTLDYGTVVTAVSVNLGIEINANGSMDGAQDVNASTATGNIAFTYHAATHTFDITMTVVGISPTDPNLRFSLHQAPEGLAGPFIVNLFNAPASFNAGTMTPTGPNSFSFTASGIAFPPASEAALFGDNTYLDIQTTAFPGGEIRGQIARSTQTSLATGTATGTGGISNIENVTGGTGNDSIVGSFSANVLNGGFGNDTIVGGPGADTFVGGASDDIMVWANGDGSDIMDGGTGNDVVQVNGSGVSGDAFLISPGAVGRLQFQRTNLGVFALDIGTTETLIVTGGVGADTFTLNALTGVTNLTSILFYGDNDNDTFTITPQTSQGVLVNGGAPTVAPGDTLTMNFGGASNPVLTSTGTGSGTWTFSNRQTVFFQSIELVAQADLAVTKTDSPDPVTAGANITYTVTLTNSGAASAPNVSLTDGVPAGTTFQSMTQTSGPAFTLTTPAVNGTGTITATNASFANGASATFTVVVKVGSGVAGGTTITNTASATTTDPESSTSNNSATATTSVTTFADLAVSKSDSPDPVTPNNNITYTITLTNNGFSDAQNVQLTDAIPANTTFVSAAQNTGPAFTLTSPAVGATGTFTASNASMTALASATFTIVVKVNPTFGPGTITNTATATTATTDPTPANDFATATTTVNAADLVVTKTDAPDPVTAGGNLTYTITLVNNGDIAATNVSLTDVIPASTTFVSATAPGYTLTTPPVGGTGTVTATNASLAPGVPTTFTLVVKVGSGTASGTVISNTAAATTSSAEANTGNNSATATTTVNTSADLAVTKSDAPDPVTPNNNISYTITLTNNGPSNAQTVQLNDAIPANTTFVSAAQNTGPAFALTTPAVGGTGTFTATNASMAGSAAATFTLVVKVNPTFGPGTVTNTATATTATPDANAGNNSATATTAVNVADLAVTKTDAPDPVSAGSNITYTITLANNGNIAAANVSLTDAVPASTTFVSFTAPAGYTSTTPAVGGTGTITATNPSLAAGATSTFTLVVQVAPATASGTLISNTASATTSTAEANTANNSATAPTAVGTAADVAVAKSATSTPDISMIAFTVTVSNLGPSSAANVTLTDAVPAGTTFVSETQTGGPVFTCTNAGTTSCTIATLAPGASATFRLVYQPAVVSSTPITNTVTVTSATTDGNPANNTASASSAPAASIPALSSLMMALLGCALATAGWLMLRRL